MKNVSKKIAAAAIVTAAALAGAQAAHAAIVTYQLQIDPANPGSSSGTNTISNYSVTAGQTVTLDIFALIQNTDGLASDDGVNVASLVFLSGGTAPVGTYLNAALAGPFQATGTAGAVNGSTTGQWGTTAVASNLASGDFDPSASSTVTGTGSNAASTTPILLGTIQYIVAPGAGNNQVVTLDPAAIHRSSGTTSNGVYSVQSDNNVFATTLGTTQQAAGVEVTLALPTVGPPPTSDISLSPAAVHAVIGTVAVASVGPNRYAGAVLPLGALNQGVNTGSVRINDIGEFTTPTNDGLSPTEVLLWLKPGFAAGDEAALQADLGTAGTIKTFAEWGDTDANNLLAAYTALGTAAGITSAPTFLVRFPGVAPSGTYNDFFNFTLPGTDSLVAVTAVPEPASLGLLAMGGLGLIARRRRSSKR